MGGRQTSGWGNCVDCGEMLKPEDEDSWSDRCPVCETRGKLYQLILKREYYIKDRLKETSTEKWKKEYGTTGEECWTKKLEIYTAMYEPLKKLRELKQKLWEECY